MCGLQEVRNYLANIKFCETKYFFLKCCFSYFPNSYNFSIRNNQKMEN